MNELRTGRVFSILVLSLALLGAAYQMARATPSALVEADNPNLWIWVYSYNYEGIEGYVYQNGGGGYVPIHRLYSPYSGEHFYTNSDGEKNYLVSIGWSYEGVRGYLSSAP